jgi:proteasome accessory factor A
MTGKTLNPPRLPKLCGADIELGNFILGLRRAGGTGYEASRALLGEIDGLPRASSYYGSCYGANGGYQYYKYDSQDWGRKFLPVNGGCIYIDLDHLELCLPEVLSAWDHVAAWHALLRIARGAQESANQKLPEGQHVQVLVNNSDGQGNSYGSHLDFLVTRRAWDNIFLRKLHYLAFLAAFQASSIIYTGQGKVGAENRAPAVGYQISQRADFFETLLGAQTTYNRPIVNSRDEALCGRLRRVEAAGDPARLHVIFFDSTLCHVSSLLKVGVMQIVLAMIEAEQVNAGLMLDDPVEAVVEFSHDPMLEARARLASGQRLTALELQFLFLEEARSFVAAGGCDGVVPGAQEILAWWEDTLLKLQARDLGALARRLDWVLKLYVLERAMEQRPELDWEAPQIKHLDLVYSSLDAAEGLYWAYERSGSVERVVSEEQIERFTQEPPEDTRAWTRAMLLRRASSEVAEVDWDSIRFKIRGRNYWPTYRTLELADPLGFTRAEAEPAFLETETLSQALDALEPPRQETAAPVCVESAGRYLFN